MTHQHDSEELTALEAECARLREDARRYRWLREQDWFDGELFVCRKPGRPQPGSDCPSRERLDTFIDDALPSEGKDSNES